MIDLQNNLEAEKSRIDIKMTHKKKTIQMLKLKNQSLNEKLTAIENKNCIFNKLDEDNMDSGRESDTSVDVVMDKETLNIRQKNRNSSRAIIEVEDHQTLPKKVVCYLTCYL